VRSYNHYSSHTGNLFNSGLYLLPRRERLAEMKGRKTKVFIVRLQRKGLYSQRRETKEFSEGEGKRRD